MPDDTCGQCAEPEEGPDEEPFYCEGHEDFEGNVFFHSDEKSCGEYLAHPPCVYCGGRGYIYIEGRTFEEDRYYTCIHCNPQPKTAIVA